VAPIASVVLPRRSPNSEPGQMCPVSAANQEGAGQQNQNG
jgi:hypothetical protein